MIVVPRYFPALPDQKALEIAMPGASPLISTMASEVAHLQGAQFSRVVKQLFGEAEDFAGAGGPATYRVLYQAHPNARAVVWSFVPRGTGVSVAAPAAPKGLIGVPGSETLTPLDVHQKLADVTDLSKLFANSVLFVEPITPGALQELTWTAQDVRLHSLVAYECIQQQLSGTQDHVDRTVASPAFKLSDEVTGSDPRGFTKLMHGVWTARANCRRHCLNWYTSPGTTGSSGGGVWTQHWEELRTRARAVDSIAGGTQTRCRMAVYVSSVTAGTFSVRLRSLITGNTGTITGITGAGWWTGAGAVGVPANLAAMTAFNLKSDAIDRVVVESTRTAGGAGTITCHGVPLPEDPS